MEKVVLERERFRLRLHRLLPCVLYCMEGECEQIIMKLRSRFKDNNNN